MNNLSTSGSDQSSVSYLSLSSEILAGYGAWEWDIASGEVQWFGVSDRLVGPLSERSTDNIQSFTDLLHPDDRTRVWQRLNDLMARHRIPYVDEYRFIFPDGSVRWMSGTGRFYYDDAGKAVRMTGILQDITERNRAQEALHESEERFAKAFRASPHPISIMEAATGRCIEVNDACLQLFGLRREDVIGHTTLMRSIWPNQEDRVRFVERLQAGRPVLDRELSFKTQTGDVRHLLVSFDMAEINGTLCLITVANDITELKLAEAKLQEDKERLQMAQSAASIGSFDWDIRAQTIAWSPELERIWGLPVGGFGGTYEHWRRQIHPDDMDEAERVVRLSLEHPGISYKYEHRIIQPDGTIRWIHANVTTRHNTAGRPMRMVGVNFDITERKQTETKLRESETRFRNVFEHAGTGIAIVNLNGNFVQCNPAYCAMLGYAEDELLDVHFSEVVHVEDRETNLAALRLLLTEVLPYFEIENRYVHKHGEPVWVRKFISLLRDDEGRPKYGLVLTTNITERRKTEQELHQAKEHLERWTVDLQKAVDEKTAELVHSQARLRSLAGELSLAEQRERKRLATELHDHLQQLLVLGKLTIGQAKQSADSPRCEAAIDRMDGILSEALTYSRTLVTELSPPVLGDHGLAAGLEWLGAYMKKHEQTVTVKVPQEQEVRLPEDQTILLFQSVRELLINSSKHAGTGRATVTMEQIDGNLCITVSDDGVGFDLAAVAAAEPHPSGGISSKFGLFSIQERMRALGGSFDLSSIPGQGTTATLMLPVSRQL